MPVDSGAKAEKMYYASMAARFTERLFLIGSECAINVCGAWDLCTGKRRIREGRRRLSVVGGWRAISRLRGGCGCQRAWPCPSASRRGSDRPGAESLAYLEPLSRDRAGAAGQAALRRNVR